jgi:hypothetical protein
MLGQLSLEVELELPLEPLDDALVFALGEAEPVAASACVTPRPPTSSPDANTVATTPRRTFRIIPITSFSLVCHPADSRKLGISGEPGERVR